MRAQAPTTPEEFARRQYDSGQECLRSGKDSEALKDFQAVVDSYPGSSDADDAMLAIARYQLDIARDPAAAQVTAESLLKKFPTSDSIPMAYVIAGQAMVARSTALEREGGARELSASRACSLARKRSRPRCSRQVTRSSGWDDVPRPWSASIRC